MSPYWRYAVVGYGIPIAWWLIAELYAVFTNRWPTFTHVVTTHVNYSLLFAATAGLGVWLLVHWKETRDWMRHQERRARRAARKAKRKLPPVVG